MTGIMQVPAASAATGTGFTAGEQVDLTDVAPSGAKQSFAPAAEFFSMAVSEQAMRMRVMDGVLKALRMRINGAMEAGAAIPLAERRRQFPFTPMTTGTLLLTRDELMVELDAEYPEYHLAQSKGYASAEHIQAIKDHGLSPVHRVSFCGNFLETARLF